MVCGDFKYPPAGLTGGERALMTAGYGRIGISSGSGFVESM
jgi:hypothetical protein